MQHEHTRSLSKDSFNVGGTLRHVAPEVHSERVSRPNTQSDVYSMGMTILELATLNPPFFKYQKAVRAAIAAEDGERPERPARLADLFFPEEEFLWGLMQGMWADNPQLRPTVRHVQDDLVHLSSLCVTWKRVRVPQTPFRP